MANFLALLNPYLGFIAIGLLLAALLVFLAVLLALRASAKNKTETSPPADARPSHRGIPAAFKEAIALMRHGGDSTAAYRAPWVLMLGEADGGKTSALQGAGLHLPFGPPSDEAADGKPPLNWWLFDNGAVMDAAGQTINDHSYGVLIRQMQRWREERPLDGIILALPASVFLGGAGDRLALMAKDMYGHLRQLQDSLEMSFPLYILITKTDAVEGFADFWSLAEAPSLEQMFGWSNPYSLQSVYESGWVNQAFRELKTRLIAIRLGLMSKGAPEMDPDKVFLFPSNFIALQDGLKLFVDGIMKPSVYYESFKLRGIYFSGQARPNEGVAFIKDLLKEKVFPEHAIAWPIHQRILSRNRRVLSLQLATTLAVVLGVTALWWEAARLSPASSDLYGALFVVKEELDRTQQSGGGFQEASATGLIKSWRHLQSGGMESLYLPSSWFTSLPSEVDAFLTNGVDRLVFSAMDACLKLEADRLAAIKGGASCAEGKKSPNVTVAGGAAAAATKWRGSYATLATYREMEQFFSAVSELTAHVDIFNDIVQANSGTPEQFQRLTKYLFNVEVALASEGERQQLRHVIKQARAKPLYLTDRTFAFRRRAAELVSGFARDVYQGNPLESAAEESRALLARFSAPASGTASGTGERVQDLQDLKNTLDSLDSLLNDFTLAFLAKGEAATGGPGPLVEGMARRSGLFAENEIDQQVSVITQEFEKMGDRIAALEPVILQGNPQGNPTTGGWKLAPEMQSLRQTLAGLFNEPFMAVRAEGEMDILSDPNKMVAWSPEGLRQAIDYYDSYERFVSGLDMAGHPALVSAVRHVASVQASNAVAAAVTASRAVIPRSSDLFGANAEEGIRREVDNLRLVQGPLMQILSLPLEGPVVMDVSLAVRIQTLQLIDAIDILEESGRHYLPRESLANWTGQTDPSLELFSVRGDKALKAYLSSQRLRLSYLANQYARPLIALAEAGTADPALLDNGVLRTWKNIIEQLDRYERQDPASTLAALEEFVAVKLPVVRLEGCAQTLGEALEAGDYFLDRLAAARQTILTRCFALDGGHLSRAFAGVSGDFAAALQGRYPFTEPGTRPPTDMDPTALRRFFLAFDRHAGAMNLTGKETGDETMDFLNRLKAARDYLAPVLGLNNPEGRARPYELLLDFQTNRPAEKAGDKLLYWTFAVGGQVIDSRSAERKTTWSPGETIEIGLHWAADAPLVPSAAQPMGEVAGRSVIARFRGTWALLDALRSRRGLSADFPLGIDAAPQTLRFPVALESRAVDPNSGQPLSTDQALVFMSVALTAPGAKDGEVTRLDIPPVFPWRLPGGPS